MSVRRYLYLGLGWLCLGLGFMGVILPILPTTPFLLLAVWAFSRSSPELAEKIRNNKTVGPFIRDWQDHGAIPVKAKTLAMLMMAATGAYLVFYSAVPDWLGYGTCGVLAAVAAYILTRPSQGNRPPSSSPPA
jgi:uncharacterized protein